MAFDPVAEGGVEALDVECIPGREELAIIDADSPLPNGFSKKKMHLLIFEDPWEDGRKKFAKKDVLHIRAEHVRRLVVKCIVCVCILNRMKNLAARAIQVVVGQEMDVRPSWWKFLRSRPNNLGLK